MIEIQDIHKYISHLWCMRKSGSGPEKNRDVSSVPAEGGRVLQVESGGAGPSSAE